MEENNNGINGVLNTPDETAQFSQQDIDGNKIMAVLSYFGFLVLVPILAAKESAYARFHANQGLVLFIVEIAVGIVSSILSFILTAILGGFGALLTGIISGVLSLAMLVLAILGIVNAATGKAKKLPVVGNFTILK